MGDMEMLQLLLVNRGESLNTKHNGLFTYFYLADLLIDSLDAVYTRGLWELCQLCQTGLVRFPAWTNLPACGRAELCEEVQFGFLIADSDSQGILLCCIAKWEGFCAKTDRQLQLFHMMLPSLLIPCKTLLDLWMKHQGFILCLSF